MKMDYKRVKVKVHMVFSYEFKNHGGILPMIC
jgi:hypothetical protein